MKPKLKWVKLYPNQLIPTAYVVYFFKMEILRIEWVSHREMWYGQGVGNICAIWNSSPLDSPEPVMMELEELFENTIDQLKDILNGK